MTASRREFIQHVGIALASMMMVRCTAGPVTQETDPSPTPGSGCAPLEPKGDSPRERLRACWTSLNWLAEQAQSGFECGDRAREDLLAVHRAAVADLTESGDVQAEVGQYVHAAFDEGVDHVWRSHAPISCYESAGPPYRYESRGQLVERANLLAEMASTGNVAPETVTQVQTALERDIAFLNLSQAEEAPYTALLSTGSDYPSYDELDLEIPSPAVQATDFLIQVLLQQ